MKGFASISILWVLGSASFAHTQNRTCCQRGAQCWPTAADVSALTNALNPSGNRSLNWAGHPNPYPGSIPVASSQPLYGLNPISPVYQRTAIDLNCISSVGILETNFCRATTRNLPDSADGEPAFVVWPLTAEHVQVAVRFATSHNLCVCIAGQAHDYLSRHSCKDGMLIRTGLMKDIQWRGADNDISVRLGAGLTFSEVQHSGAQQKQPSFVQSGWVTTVGVIGWHTGGGHGPTGRSVGLGVDNILAVELVTADGNLVTANATHNPDLLWGVRGGGGSIWGVITALTVKGHAVPKGGVTVMHLDWKGDMCGDEQVQLNNLIDKAYNFSLTADSRYSGLIWTAPSASTGPCAASYHIVLIYVFLGPITDPVFQQNMAEWTSIKEPSVNNATQYKNMWDAWAEDSATYMFTHPEEWYIFPVKAPNGGVPSVLLSADVIANGTAANLSKAHMAECKAKGSSHCVRHEIFNDVPGTINDKFDHSATSVSEGFRKACIHHLHFLGANGQQTKEWTALGDSAYFSESETGMADWKQRYWGTKYAKLLTTKQKYDPKNMFTCHHCVGSDLPQTPTLESLVVV